MPYQIRLAQQQDIVPVSRILVNSFFQKCPQWLYPVVLWSVSLDLGARLTDINPRYACLIVIFDSEPIATLEISLKPISTHNFKFWQTSMLPYISNLAVHERWRRQGIATKLLTAAEQKVKSWGFSGIYLHVMGNNPGGLGLYKLASYQVCRADLQLGFNPLLAKRFLLYKTFS